MSGLSHRPVMLAEVMKAIAPRPGQVIVDGTFGAGGYSRAFLAAGARVVAFDRDPTASRFADDLPGGETFELVQEPFSAMARLGEGRVSGVALDLGLSSMQLDQASRGFSLLRDGPLDMRMSGAGRSAADLVNGADAAELANIFREWGEEPHARRIAGAVVRRRAQAAFVRTLDLAEVVEKAVGGRRGARVHPATRVFQALRIAVNEELAELERGLLAAERVLSGGGRLAVVSFHSLEDRLVKSFLQARSGLLGAASRHAPPRAPDAAPSFCPLSRRALRPSEQEIQSNPRARSARMRAAARTDSPAWSFAT